MKLTVQRHRRSGLLDKALGLLRREQPVVEVGFPSSVDGGVIERAIYNEFGTRTIPERPFFRNAMAGNKNKYQAQMRQAAKAIIAGRMTVEQALERLGIQAQGDIQEEITNLRNPPNAPGTIKAKGSSNPLIDTGEMRQAVTYRVRRR